MANIWFTSDLHLCHDREFVWKARGFNSVDEMNQAIVNRFNSVIQPEDTLYILGDVMLNDNVKAEQYLAQIKGKKIFIRGNHDTNSRVEIYKKYTDAKIKWADIIKIKGRSIYISHYPTYTANADDAPGKVTLNFHGHTHQICNFTTNGFYMYHVGVDSHDCYPVLVDTIFEDIKEERESAKNENETDLF